MTVAWLTIAAYWAVACLTLLVLWVEEPPSTSDWRVDLLLAIAWPVAWVSRCRYAIVRWRERRGSP